MKEEILLKEGQILLLGEVHGHPVEKTEHDLSETSLPDGLSDETSSKQLKNCDLHLKVPNSWDKFLQGCHSSEFKMFPDFSLTPEQFFLTLIDLP